MPVPSVCGVVLEGGTSTAAGVLLVGALVRLWSSDRGEGTGGLLVGVGLARCWVLREQPVGCCFGVASLAHGVPVFGACGWGWRSADRPGGVEPSSAGAAVFREGGPVRSGGGRRLAVQGGPGRCLRTAQWTRASLKSLWSSL